jgi:hypothetical protein
MHNDVTPSEDKLSLCNDFASKINFHDVQLTVREREEDDVHNDNVSHANIQCCSDISVSCTTSPATTSICDNDKSNDTNIRFICDLGYGLPKEVRPRKEKVHAIAKQLVTFLSWQSQQSQVLKQYPVAPIYIILGKTTTSPESTTITFNESSTYKNTAIPPKPPDAIGESVSGTIRREEHEEAQIIHESLLSRMREVWDQVKVADPSPPFPETIISFCHQSLSEFLEMSSNCSDTIQSATNDDERVDNDTVYLSPDANHTLDITKPPPRNIIIGLLIDRRTIQYNRSVLRAQEHNIHAVRWPIENIMMNSGMIIHKNEPLNVDCVLEGMQQWHWNFMARSTITQPPHHEFVGNEMTLNSTIPDPVDCSSLFQMAALQAIQHHTTRHPHRPLHKT